MKRLVFIVHGIHNDRAEARAWMGQLAQLVAGPDVDVRLFVYGWLSAAAIRLPGIGGVVRRRHVRRFQRAVASALGATPEAPVDAIAHSFGTFIVWNAMTQPGAPRAVFRRLCLMASIVSSRQDFVAQRGHFGRLLNLFSRHDRVVMTSTFGQSGWRGFAAPLPATVRNVEAVGYAHCDYERPGPAWGEIVAELAAPDAAAAA